MPDKQMVGNVYSEYILALERAEDKIKELEEDVFICEIKHPSGTEYVFKTRKEIMGTYLDHIPVLFDHKFSSERRAREAAAVFGNKLSVRPCYKIRNNYQFISHFSILNDMFNVDSIKTALFGTIGLRDSDNPEIPVNTLTGATASVYFDDYHPLITFDNLYYIAPNYDGMNYAAWTATAYATGDCVMYDKIAYKAQRTMATGDTPSLTSTAWQTPVKDWITNKQYASVNKLCNHVFTNKKLRDSTKTFLDSVQVIDGTGRIEDTVTANGRFVGYEINLKRINNIKAVIKYIGLHFTQVQTDLTIYLFHSSQKTAVATWVVTTATANCFDWITATVTTGSNELNYIKYSTNIDSGGTFYLGYFEDDITGSAIEKKNACCNSYPNSRFKWSRWAEIRPIEVASGGLDGTNIFDIDEVGYTDSNNGINLSFSIETDLTDMLVNNKGVFTNAFGLQFASDMIESYIFNSDSRMAKRQDTATRHSVAYEWSGTDNPLSIRRRLADAVKALDFELSRISQALPRGGRGLKIGSV